MHPKSNTEEFKKLVYDLVGDEYSVLGEYIGDKKKILMQHNKCGFQWMVAPYHFKKGIRCPKCNGNLKGTTESFKQEVYNLVGDEYSVLGEYVNNSTKILMKHNTCGNIYEVRPADFKKGKQRCKQCLQHSKEEKFKQQVYDLVGDEYSVVSKYTKTNEPITLYHKNCGKTYEITPHAFLVNGVRCKHCSSFNTERFKQEVFDLVSDEYTVLGEYVNNDTKILMRHNTCGTEYEVTPHNFKQGNRCKSCRILNKTFTTSDFAKQVYDLVGDEYSVIGAYVNSNVKIRIRHNTCGYEYNVLPHHFTSKMHRCPKCSHIKGYSNGEKELFTYIQSFYKDNIIENDRTILDGKELDLYFPERKLAIEYDGLYWHNEKRVGTDYHLSKTTGCNLKNIQLIHIFEDEWNFKQDIVKFKIRYLLGYSKNLPKIRASKCYIEEISSKDKNTFLNENHIQGEDKSSVKLGLWYPISNEESRLVSVMTFCKPRFSKKYDYELSRFANDIEYQIYGSFDKLFNYFKDNYEWNSIITYADRRWSKGSLYESTGFKLYDISKPSYYYTNYVDRENRIKYQKYKLRKIFPEYYSDDLTEFQIMNKTKLSRIWDCGNYVYTYIR